MRISSKFAVVLKAMFLPLVSSLALAATAQAVEPLHSLQWGLDNTGQIVNESYTDIDFLRIQGTPGIDVNMKSNGPAAKALVAKEVLVAVIDSGVDVTHPDLQGKIFVNGKDCDSLGHPPFRAEDDKDANGYAGDCMGWNVSGNGDDNRVNDDIGHGTHVSGVIAAVDGNKVGISGVAAHVKILPIKLTYQGDQGQGYTSRMLQALQYAITMKADVINLSLGWPAAADTQALQAKVQEALQKNIVIVVAAGNNTTDKPIYPCSYEGVVCVGSINPDGKSSQFSNYGGHVDVLAPGAHILSLIPTAVAPSQFSLTGYDFKSGTSQATPFVSAAFAVLKSIYPNSSTDELKARLLLSSMGRPSSVSSIAGLIQIDKAVAIAAQPAVFPVIKGEGMIAIKADGHLSFNIALKNYWQASGAVSTELSASPNFKLDQSQFNLPMMSGGERKEITISGRMDDLSQSHIIQFTLKVTQNKQTREYQFTKTIVNTVTPSVSELARLDLDLSGLPGAPTLKQLHLQTIKNSYQPLDEREYFFTYVQGANQNLVVLRRAGSKLVPSVIVLKTSETILNFIKMDLNGDGQADYLLQTFDGVSNPQNLFKLAYLNRELRPLYDVAAFTYDVATAMLSWRDLAWVYSSYKGQKILMPVFKYKGRVAKIDHHKNPFDDNDDDTVTDRLYYFVPNAQSNALTVRSFDTFARTAEMNKTMGISYPEDLSFKLIYPQTLSEIKNGEARVLIEVAGGARPRYYQLRLGANASLKSLSRLQGQFSLQGFQVVKQAGLDASSDNLFLARTQSANIIEFAWVRGLNEPKFYSYTHNQKGDNIIGALMASSEKDGLRLVIETKVHVVSLYRDSSGHQTVSLNPINRSSVLNGNIFSELFVPVKIAGQAGLYIDASQLYRGHAYALSATPTSLRASVANSLQIAEACSTLNPSVQGNDSQFVIYCENSQSDHKSIYQQSMK